MLFSKTIFYFTAAFLLLCLLYPLNTNAMNIQNGADEDPRFVKGKELYQKLDYEGTLKEFKPLAKAGNCRAQACVAHLYESKLHNLEKATKWYLRAAENGNITGKLYFTLEKFNDKLITPEKTVQWLIELSNEEYVSTTWKLYEIYSNGWETIPPSPSKAQVYFLRALQELDKDELYALGKQLFLKRKDGSAFRLLYTAKKEGHPLAQKWLNCLIPDEEERKRLTKLAYHSEEDERIRLSRVAKAREVLRSLTKQGHAPGKGRERVISRPLIHKE